MRKALGYMRTSSASNVGADKDSESRQRAAVEAYAASAGIEIVGWHYDTAVSGADPIDTRPGFTALLTQIAGNCIRTIVVETANRFARDLIVQEIGHKRLRSLGIDLIAADSPGAFVEDTPTARLVRQVLGAVSEFEKAALVAKLKGARDRKKALTGKCGGRRAHSELRPAAVALAQELRGSGHTLRDTSAKLAEVGFLNDRGSPFNSKSVRAMTRKSA